MENQRMPKQGEIYRHFKDGLYQIVTMAVDSETSEPMVVYQALYGDFKTYVRRLQVFVSEVDHKKYPEIEQKYRFELIRDQAGEAVCNQADCLPSSGIAVDSGLADTAELTVEKKELQEQIVQKQPDNSPQDTVNSILLKFLDAPSYSKKLEVLSSNIKHLDNRLINDMAVALDCAVDEGPLDTRIQGLIHCLQAMCRFEDRRLR